MDHQAARLRRFRAIAMVLALLLLAVGSMRLVLGSLSLIDPALTTATYSCDPCVLETDVVRLLEPESTRVRVRETPGGADALRTLVSQPRVKLMLFISEWTRAVPFFLIVLSMAMGVRSLARTGFSEVSVRWLRRATTAGVAWTLLQPVSMSLRWTALSPVSHGKPIRHIVFDTDALVLGVILSAAAWIITWSLEEARAMRIDLEEYV